MIRWVGKRLIRWRRKRLEPAEGKGAGPPGAGGGGDEPPPEEPNGPWGGRVEFSPGGWLAYRPGQVLVRATVAEPARVELGRIFPASRITDEPILGETFVRFGDVPDVPEAIEGLGRAGIAAQPNHVLFATGCWCPPHPSDPEAASFYGDPTAARSVSANPFWANPFWANPFWANPGGGCCCCGSGDLLGNPFWPNADPSPILDTRTQATGRRRSSAQPDGPPPTEPGRPVKGDVRVAILDTGWAQSHEPSRRPRNLLSRGGDHPDEDGDGFLDPAAGHGTFIAGVIDHITPDCTLEAIPVLRSYGDGDEEEIGEALLELAERPEPKRPHLVNLSFGGYSPLGMDALALVVSRLHEAGTAVVASAGNDGTCIPLYPAALPEVVSVGALDEEGRPARFTNYGPWVRACSRGVDLVSLFFQYNGNEPPGPGGDPDDFRAWARWSGTSFAAPGVVAALALLIDQGHTPHQAVEKLIDDPSLPRQPMLGTVVETA